ncbi:MAG: GNAT family protein [Anaerolineaceae bacterium]
MIIGKELRLRAIERSDLPRFVHWLNDPEVIENLIQRFPLSLAHEETWYEENLKKPKAEQSMVIETWLADEWTPIGVMGLFDLYWLARTAEVGIFIGEKQLWNRGLGTKAMCLLLRYAFTSLNLNKIKLHVYETNPRAIQSYRKAGFVEEGRLRKEDFINGRYVDVIYMGILRDEWQDNHSV